MKRTLASALGVAALGVLTFVPTAAQVAQEAVDLDVVERIRDEGLDRSQIPELAGHLTDVIGPRLTNSPGIWRAQEWLTATFDAWGLENIEVEPWGEFGRGWENVELTFRALTPYPQPLSAWPTAWTGSTEGTVRGPAVIVEAETPEDLEAYRGKLAGAFVLMRPYEWIEPDWEPRERRQALDWLLEPPVEREQPEMTEEQRAERERMIAEWRARRALMAQVAEMVADEGAAAILSPSGWTGNLLRMGGTRAYQADEPIPGPQLVLSHEDYGQIWRNVKRGVPMELELNVQNRWYDDDLQGKNVLADLPGTDLADEYIMIGGHYDSWHAGTGAADNAAGTVVMMEALRILKELGLQPRRTIRIALWSGEEQGLYGSRMWVENHPELHDRISAYLNFDNGTGRIRGIYNQMNEGVTPIFEQLLWPFRDLGVVAVKHANTGGTDHLAFDGAGIPGFQFIQDPIEYSVNTHHSNIDTYERLVMDDLKQAAVVVASLVYHLANRDEMLPRKPMETMSQR
ncbi:MAG: M20/M25/M40 family metallo-hydrolase [Longimicrobiales bacterium]